MHEHVKSLKKGDKQQVFKGKTSSSVVFIVTSTTSINTLPHASIKNIFKKIIQPLKIIVMSLH